MPDDKYSNTGKHLLKQPNPLIDSSSAETLANVQAMLARIQILRVERPGQQSQTDNNNTTSIHNCPGNELYSRLLLLVREAIDHELGEINKS